MNIVELENRLHQENVSEHAYAINNDGSGECYVLTHEGAQWLVYYSERGLRQDLHVFNSEQEACNYFLNWVLNDSTTRVRKS